ncbi:helix-turn-helix domain-containing protein [Nonomuraea sp. NPDC001023]|uniref:helix-turn-helix domain-containing protein n=1 Tax=unclassified Nonomuraea TaxID=2593643 RepID=UPI0033204748
MQDPLESPWPPTSGSVAHRARHWYQLGHEPGLPGGHVLYPHGLAHLVIVLDGGPCEPAVFGLRTRPVEVGVPVGARSLDVCMTPRVAHAVFGLPMNRLVDAPVELREATGRAGERLVGALRAASSWPEVFVLADRFLRDRLGGYVPETDVVTRAWRLLAGRGGRLPVAELCRRTGMSERLLELRFREQVGLPPKASARLLRLWRALRLLARRRPGARVAIECGFYDQAHLARDCKALTGRRPSWFARADRAVRQHVEHFGFVQDWLVGVGDHDEGG